jgi:outer membrane immunogenic protein
MRKILGLVGATLLLAGPVCAADLVTNPVYKAPPLVPVFSWTGCYIGADVGGAWSRQTASVNTMPFQNQASVSGGINGSSAIGGPYVGCNYQFAPGWVLGVEGDFGWASLSGATSGPNLFANGTPATLPGVLVNGVPIESGGVSWSEKTDWLASFRGRLGYAVVPNVLVYGTGGAAWTRTSYSALDAFTGGCPNCSTTAFEDTRTGWVAGAGIDWAPWSNNWILRLEYLHYQFGGVTSTVAGATNFVWGDLKIDTVRAGLSYKF